MKISKKALSLVLVILMTFFLTSNCLTFAAEGNPKANTYQDSGFTKVTGIELDKTSLTLECGSSETLSATIHPGNATDQDIGWSYSNGLVCNVDQHGKVTAVGNGTAKITVTTNDGGYKATCTVKVITSVRKIFLDKTALRMLKGSKNGLTATEFPDDAVPQEIEWSSSDEGICSVDSSGTVSALKVGTATITARTKESGLTDSCTVTVYTPVTDITLDKSQLNMTIDSTENLKATVSPSDSNQKVRWSSSNKLVCTVDQNGKVSATGVGSAEINATASSDGTGTLRATCNVSVITPVAGLTFAEDSMTIPMGSQESIVATITPTGASKYVDWATTDSKVCTVDSSGKVTAIHPGKASIIACSKDARFIVSCEITVPTPITAFSLDKTSMTLSSGEKEQITAEVTPADASKYIVWTTDDTNVCTVDSFGNVTAVNPGIACITASSVDGIWSADCQVTVADPITGLSFDKTSMTIPMGSKESITATVTPSDSSKYLKWFSFDDDVCTVDSSGNVTAIHPGTAYVIAVSQDGLWQARCEVTVAAPITGLSLDKTKLTLPVGSQDTITAKVTPTDSVKYISWYSSNSNVCTVDSAGRIAAIHPGTAYIVATSQDGLWGKTCVVTVPTT